MEKIAIDKLLLMPIESESDFDEFRNFIYSFENDEERILAFIVVVSLVIARLALMARSGKVENPSVLVALLVGLMTDAMSASFDPESVVELMFTVLRKQTEVGLLLRAGTVNDLPC